MTPSRGGRSADCTEPPPLASGDGLDADIRLTRTGFSLDARLALPPRGVSALFGPSGSGKTTCLRCIAGLEPNADARIAFGDALWHDSASKRFVPAHQRPIGMVFQDGQLFAHLTVRANIEYGMKRVPAAERRIALDDMVDLLAIGPLLQRRPAGLSGGERQRVAIARALLASPRLLLLDEPLAALDEARKAEVLPYLERLRDDLALPMVYVSHAFPEVARLADHLVLLREGQVVASGPVAELASRLDLPLASGDDAGAVVRGRIVAHDDTFLLSRVDMAGQALWIARAPRPVGAEVRLQIAARDVSVTLAPAQDSSILNVVPAVVTGRADDDRGRTLLQLDVSGVRVLARVTRRSATLLGLHEGRPVFAQVKGVALLA